MIFFQFLNKVSMHLQADNFMSLCKNIDLYRKLLFEVARSEHIYQVVH